MAARNTGDTAQMPEPEVRVYLRARDLGRGAANLEDARWILGELRRGKLRAFNTKLHTEYDGFYVDKYTVSEHYAIAIGFDWYSHAQVREILRELMEMPATPYHSFEANSLRMCLYEERVPKVHFWCARDKFRELHARIRGLTPVGRGVDFGIASTL